MPKPLCRTKLSAAMERGKNAAVKLTCPTQLDSAMPRPDPPCLTAALDYLRRYWSVIPLCPPGCNAEAHGHRECSAKGKRPLGEAWKPSMESRASEKVVRVWWNRWPDANVGVAMGPVSGLIGIDLDGQAAEDWFAAWGPLPLTLEFTTGHGRRLLFRWPTDTEIKNTEWKCEGGEVRVIGQGRQTVMPPSRHASGTDYRWEEKCGPGDMEAAPLPAWLLEKIREGKAPPPPAAKRTPATEVLARARAYLKTIPGAVSGQGGHDITWDTAVKVVRGFGLSEEEGYDLLAAEYNPRCQPPWSEKELRHKVRKRGKTRGCRKGSCATSRENHRPKRRTVARNRHRAHRQRRGPTSRPSS